MCAQATITNGTTPHRLRCAAIILLALSVFTLGLHAKLALYKPVPPSMLITLTKLALNEPSNIASSMLATEAVPEGALLNGGDGGEIAISDAKIAVPGGELNTLAQTEIPPALFKDVYAIEPLRIIRDMFAVLLLDGKHVGAGLHTDHAGFGIPLEAENFGAGLVADHIAGIIERRPGAACAGEIGTMRERLELATIRRELAGALQPRSRSPAGPATRRPSLSLRWQGCWTAFSSSAFFWRMI